MNFSQNSRLRDALHRGGAAVVRVDFEGWHYVLLIFGVDTSIQLGEVEGAVETAVAGIGDQIVDTFTVSDFPLLISRSHILALIVFTVFFGVTVSALGEKGRPVAQWLSNLSLVFYKMVELLMKMAPLGLLAYFANLTGTYGADLLKSYARGPLIYYLAAIVYFFVSLVQRCASCSEYK